MQSSQGHKEPQLTQHIGVDFDQMPVARGYGPHVIAASGDHFPPLLQRIGLGGVGICAGGDDAVQGRLHRAGGDLKWLEEIGANTEDDDGADHEGLDPVAGAGVGRGRHSAVAHDGQRFFQFFETDRITGG